MKCCRFLAISTGLFDTRRGRTITTHRLLHHIVDAPRAVRGVPAGIQLAYQGARSLAGLVNLDDVRDAQHRLAHAGAAAGRPELRAFDEEDAGRGCEQLCESGGARADGAQC